MQYQVIQLYFYKSEKKIRELLITLTQTCVAPDLTILAEHITDSGVVQMDYQQEPLVSFGV